MIEYKRHGNNFPNYKEGQRQLSRHSSQRPLVPATSNSYTFTRYIPRSLLNTLGPGLVTAFYLFIVFVYLLRSGLNGIVPSYPINARGVFFAWLILSIFLLDWAKSAIAGFEAAALMKRKLAPSNAMQLMWHTDKAWGSLSGWWKALVANYSYLRHRILDGRSTIEWQGPGCLWWYLAFSSFLLYAAIPLAGLSLDPKEAERLTDRKITILGPNQTSFELRGSNAVAERTSERWRQGNPTTPHGDTILYATKCTENVSSTYYEEYIQSIYNGQYAREIPPAGSIKFFSGPEVSERAHGNAWGFLTSLTCSVAHPYRDLELLKVESINEWKSPSMSSSSYGNTSDSFYQQSRSAGSESTLFSFGQSFGISYQYVMASSNNNIDLGGGDYVNSTILPLKDFVELVMWQSYQKPFTADATFANLSSHPSVVSSFSPINNVTYLGYGIRCSVVSDVGFADLDAAARTYSDFKSNASLGLVSTRLGDGRLVEYPGMLSIVSLVFAAFTKSPLGYIGAPNCDTGSSATCDPWSGANVATNGVPAFITDPSFTRVGNLQYPTIGPERMNLAIYKLFGEAAIALMVSGGGSWVGELKGLESTNELVPGRVPWIVVAMLLGIWTLITVLPNCLTFAERRWAGTLDGFEMFRLGAEWTNTVWKFEGSEFKENPILLEVPGMIGDMEPRETRGFTGLSRSMAKVEGRIYSYNRASPGH